MQVKRPAFMKGKTQRGGWIWDSAAGDFVPRSEYRAKANTGGIQVIPDIKPYKSVTGEVIGGRKQHRDFLRAHGLVEVGNEKPSAAPKPKMPDVRHDVKAALDMVRGGYRPGPVGAFRDE
jgi:hypothetical protein